MLKVFTRENPPDNRLDVLVEGMCDFYRYGLAAGMEGLVPLKDEWEAVSGFLAVKKLSYRDGLDLECQIDKKALEFPIPRIFLQPLVDNAVKYSRKANDLPVKVRISVTRAKDGSLLVEVGNIGPWYDPEFRTQLPSYSLDNLRERLAAYYPGKKHEMTISATPKWVSVKIRLSNPKDRSRNPTKR